MKKVVVALSMLFLVAEVNFPAEAGIKSRVLDLVKGRKNDDNSKIVEKIASALKGLGSNFASSGSSQFKYVNSKFLTSQEDMSFLIAYSSFARNSEMFFSLLESLTSKIRTEYSSILGAQSRIEKAKSDRKIEKNEASIEQNRENVKRCIEILGSNGITALRANLQCSSIILLKIIEETETVPPANLPTIRKQIEAFIKKYSIGFETISNNLEETIEAIQEAAEIEADISHRLKSLIDDVTLVHNVLKTLNRYVSGRVISSDEVNKYLSNAQYYYISQQRNNNQNQSDSDEDDEYETDDEDEYYSDEEPMRRNLNRNSGNMNSSRNNNQNYRPGNNNYYDDEYEDEYDDDYGSMNRNNNGYNNRNTRNNNNYDDEYEDEDDYDNRSMRSNNSRNNNR